MNRSAGNGAMTLPPHRRLWCSWVPAFSGMTKWRCSSHPRKPRQSTPRGVHAVLGLAPDRAARAFDHFVGDLLAAARGEAVQEIGIVGLREQSLVDLIGREGLQPGLGFVVLAHRHPD